MALPFPEQTLTVDEYLQMVADGVFSEDARIEPYRTGKSLRCRRSATGTSPP